MKEVRFNQKHGGEQFVFSVICSKYTKSANYLTILPPYNLPMINIYSRIQ